MTEKQFYASNQQALYDKVRFQRAEARAMLADWIREGTFTAEHLRKHLAGPNKWFWETIAGDFMPLLEKQEMGMKGV